MVLRLPTAHVVLLEIALHRQRRIERALRHFHLQLRHVDIVLRRGHRRMGGAGDADRARQAVRREAVDRRAGRELARIAADHLAIGRRRGLVVGFRGEHLRAAGGQPRFRLRHVGARHLADIEAVAGLPQLLLQHLDVAPLQIEDRGVAQQVHVGGDRVEQHRLLGHAQGRARGQHLRSRPGGCGWRSGNR